MNNLDMSTGSIIAAVASVIAAFISGAVVMRGQRLEHYVKSRSQGNEEVRTIFDGYGQIVEELRLEVDRLNLVILSLQEEQAACEQRNNELISEVEDLKARIACLEGDNGRT